MASNCAKCIKSLRNSKSKIICNDCKNAFHFNCVDLTPTDAEFLVEQNHIWRCDICSVERRKSLALESKDSVCYEDILNLFKELKTKFNDLESNLGKSINCCHDELKIANESLNSQNVEIASLKASLEKMSSENSQLRNTICKLEVRVEELEQYSRRNTFKIHGVPQYDNESVLAVVSSVGEALGMPIDESMIDACHRLRARSDSGKPPGIIVKMVRRIDTEKILKKRREKKDLSTRHLGMASDLAVYVNESLSPGNRRLLAAARAVKKTKGYRYLWIRNGNILLRKEEGQKVVAIKTLSDLDELQ